MIYFQDGDYERTAEAFREVSITFNSIGAVSEEAVTLDNLAYVLYYGLSERQEAIDVIGQAIDLLEQNNLPFDAAGTSIEEYRAFLDELQD